MGCFGLGLPRKREKQRGDRGKEGGNGITWLSQHLDPEGGHCEQQAQKGYRDPHGGGRGHELQSERCWRLSVSVPLATLPPFYRKQRVGDLRGYLPGQGHGQVKMKRASESAEPMAGLPESFPRNARGKLRATAG